ncbi:MAG: universal stress protein [Chloroflexota bacterium]
MTKTTNKILACVDGSLYTDSVLDHAAWASKRLSEPIQVLHAQMPNSDLSGPVDLSGTLTLGVKSALLEKLTQVDEARGKLDQQKGKLILAHAREQLTEQGIDQTEISHRHGSLVETITELESLTQLIVMGKRGEHADFATLHLGSNLERVARTAQNPVLVASRSFHPINRFVIAYDGGQSVHRAIDYVINSPLLQGLECHILRIGPDNDSNRRSVEEVATTLIQAGFSVQTVVKQGQTEEILAAYVTSNKMNLLIMGAYGHSHIRTLIIGSTTSAMLRSCPIPVLMFR